MKSLIQQVLGDEWNHLPPALQAHYKYGAAKDVGHLDIEYPGPMQPLLNILYRLGALVNRSEKQVETVVEKWIENDRQYWKRSIQYADGKVINFSSFWVAADSNQIIEFVNRFLGLQMAVQVLDNRLYYHGIKFILKLGLVYIPIPEWLVLGHTTIVEAAVDETHFKMDFRITHPVFGQIYRYAGKFEAI